MTQGKRLRVLVTNDDGPPSDRESPFVYGFVNALEEKLGWDVKVVLPASQKSWIGKAYELTRIIHGSRYDPETGEISSEDDQTESKKWILLEGTPATCANIALHNIYPDEIDLVISGPNFGRNTSTAFTLSSGTIGAALSASLSSKCSIAVSYGIVEKPVPKHLIPHAHDIACNVVSNLWNKDFSHRVDKVCSDHFDVQPDLYNINIPLVESIASAPPPIHWTDIALTNYGSLFKPLLSDSKQANDALPSSDELPAAGPGALEGEPQATNKLAVDEQNSRNSSTKNNKTQLQFKFSPDFTLLVNPPPESLVEGTDKWAIYQEAVSVTPLKASFASVSRPPFASFDNNIKYKY